MPEALHPPPVARQFEGMSLRSIPSVEHLVAAAGDAGLPRPLIVAAARQLQAGLRATGGGATREAVLEQWHRDLAGLRQSRLQPVINGTGIVLHTNLGRAPLSAAALAAITRIAGGYCNLELDLATGERGSRAGYLENALALLCGAEAATVVNNGAAALVLLLRQVLRDERREVIVSRGELVQIGGGFRIPEILETSGARLREVGTTNRTATADYARAINRSTALILKVHRSNFFMEGFVETPATAELVALGRRRRIPVFEDLGSGATTATETLGLDHEPQPAEVLRQGVATVCFSGDKLFGGPQAGIIAGRRRWVAACRRDPMFRALRCDKLIFAALQEVADQHLRGGFAELPAGQLIGTSAADLQARAGRLQAALADLPVTVTLAASESRVGGGTLPRSRLPGVAVDLVARDLSAAALAGRLRAGTPAVITCLHGRRVRVDLRTVFPESDAALTGALRQALLPP